MRRQTVIPVILAAISVGALAATITRSTLWAAQGTGAVIVVYPASVPAYGEAVEGMLKRLPQENGPTVIDIEKKDGVESLRRAMTGKPRLAIAVGSEALKAVAGAGALCPVISTMTMQPVVAEGAAPQAAVSLDVAPADLVAEIGKVLPKKVKLGVIVRPAPGGYSKLYLQARFESGGYRVEVVECANPADLVPGFLSLKGKADFVLCLPDTVLYNSATIKPLILASLENRLPIIGFSLSFLRAGAALGVYPDFRSVGAQTADLARKLLTGDATQRVEPPRTLVVAVNQRITRLLGLDSIVKHTADVTVIR